MGEGTLFFPTVTLSFLKNVGIKYFGFRVFGKIFKVFIEKLVCVLYKFGYSKKDFSNKLLFCFLESAFEYETIV